MMAGKKGKSGNKAGTRGGEIILKTIINYKITIFFYSGCKCGIEKHFQKENGKCVESNHDYIHGGSTTEVFLISNNNISKIGFLLR